MKQVFYIHGGESYENYGDFLDRLKTKDIWDLPSTQKSTKWTKKLAQELGDDYEVFMPEMPNKQNAKYDEWKIWFEKHFDYLGDGIVVIGCSLGGMFLAKYFSENQPPFSIKELILMATPLSPTAEDKEGGDFWAEADKLKNLSQVADKVLIMHSRDDFVVAYEQALLLHQAISGSELVTFKDKNHFLIEDFPEVIEHIKGLFSKE